MFALFAIPLLLKGYGDERFGFLAIAWSLIGYFSIFDLGMGRALTKLVSERLAVGCEADIPDIARTALSTMLVFGGLAFALLFALAPLLAQLLKFEHGLYHESVASMRWLALGVPFVILSAGLVGLLEAHSKFQSINTIRLLMGLMNFAAPLVVLSWSRSLVPATLSLTITRALTTILYCVAVGRLQKADFSKGSFKTNQLRRLLGFGGWITLSNLVSPIMAQLDKLLIGSVVALSLLPLYSIPGDLINRLSFVPIAVVGVFFPAFAAYWASRDHDRISTLYSHAGRALLAAVFPVSLSLFTLAPEGLSIWVGEDFSRQSTPILRCLCVGLLVNTAARVPHAFLQAIGKPSVTAKIHLIELPVYGLGLWWMLGRFGILGAASAWTARMILDLGLLAFFASGEASYVRREVSLSLVAVALGVAAMYMTSLLAEVWLRLAICACVALMGFATTLRVLLVTRHHV
ncbi:flippase [Pseudoxanthomonas suwonensis]|uniref:flippase n=1 Tax=Pseudoxanthomonas suwonensis TaxID=314722 RepID=UPI0018CC4F9A